MLLIKKIAKQCLPYGLVQYLLSKKGRLPMAYAEMLGKRTICTIQNFENLDLPLESFCPMEKHRINDFYGNATVLKRYANISEGYQIKASIMHSGTLVPHWKEEANLYPTYFCYSSQLKSQIKEFYGKHIEAIAAPFCYSSSLYSKEYISHEKKRLGKNLLIFPTHSTHFIKSIFNIDSFLNNIQKYFQYFESIRFCVYWKDRDLYNELTQRGYECVSAGHMFDTSFLPRLNTLLSIADATYSNRYGSYFAYSLFLGKPFLVEQQEVRYFGEQSNLAKKELELSKNILDEFYALFSSNFTITSQQQKFADKYFGILQKKTPEYLRQIFFEAEQRFTNK